MDIIQNHGSLSNKEMYKYCDTLKIIISKTKEHKVGKGKSIEVVMIPKYKTEPEIVNRINNSCTHYKKLMENKIQFRDYQIDIIDKGSLILKNKGFVYLAMEVRTGKTLTSLGIAECLSPANVLFITKKKAISSIQSDYDLLQPSYKITIINYESLHTVMDDFKWDIIICDEAHSMG
ncbi:MAG: hypothetical protein JHC33_03655, partial [Ignisphaera sp.]|nr:hypothetical protein [Ignisphaera sp.]